MITSMLPACVNHGFAIQPLRQGKAMLLCMDLWSNLARDGMDLWGNLARDSFMDALVVAFRNETDSGLIISPASGALKKALRHLNHAKLIKTNLIQKRRSSHTSCILSKLLQRRVLWNISAKESRFL